MVGLGFRTGKELSFILSETERQLSIIKVTGRKKEVGKVRESKKIEVNRTNI